MRRAAWAPGACVLGVVLLVTAMTALPVQADQPRVDLVIDARTLGNGVPLEEWESKRPSLWDVTGDGRLEILAQNGNGHVYVIDARTGRALAELLPHYPYGPDLGPFNGPRAADLDGDGAVEIVNVNRAAVVSVWRVDPESSSTEELSTTLLWERHLNDFHWKPTADAGAVLGDLTEDGKLELVIQTEETGVFALTHDGSVLWALAEWGGNAEAVLEDVNRDGALDAVFFTDAGRVYVVDGPTGEILWDFHATHHDVWPGSAASPGIVDDLDGDGVVEVVFCARNLENASPDHAPGAPHYRQHHFALIMVRDGQLSWIVKPSWGNPLCSAYLFAHDADGDGRKEIFGMDWNTIGHKPGDWEVTGDPNVFAFDADGREAWHAPMNRDNAKAAIAMADWDGDGDQDVVAYSHEHLVALDARNGHLVDRVHLGWGRQVKQGPLMADLYGDGRLHAVVAVYGDSDAFLVVDAGVPFRSPAWPGWGPPAVDPPRLSRIPAVDPEDNAPMTSNDSRGREPTPPSREAPSPAVVLVVAALALAARSRARVTRPSAA